MPKRRANGEGNIRKRKDGRWEGRYTAGYDPETGKRIIKNVLGKTQVYAFLRCFRPGFSVRGSRRGSTGDFSSCSHVTFCVAGINKTFLEKVIAFRQQLWYVLWLQKRRCRNV